VDSVRANKPSARFRALTPVGLDDGAWWSFSKDQVEATAGFFVAFTRAKQRVLFTYCPSRGERETIATLYELLQHAGVSVLDAG
jgi:hypothetical protein